MNIAEEKQSISHGQWFARVPMGVITQYELLCNGHLFLTELWRNTVNRCSCGIAACQHGRMALLLEEQYQQEHAPKDLGHCILCGHIARVVRGVAICPRCV
jgi:hypothetical protein